VPIFYLHISESAGFVEDTEGHELADVATAIRVAAEGLRDILAAELRNGNLDTVSFVEIENDQHELLATVTFDDIVKVSEPRPKPPR
jgi:hypothetical protein